MCREKEEQMPDNVEIIIFSKFPLFLTFLRGLSSHVRVFCRFYCFYHFFTGLSRGEPSFFHFLEKLG